MKKRAAVYLDGGQLQLHRPTPMALILDERAGFDDGIGSDAVDCRTAILLRRGGRGHVAAEGAVL